MQFLHPSQCECTSRSYALNIFRYLVCKYAHLRLKPGPYSKSIKADSSNSWLAGHSESEEAWSMKGPTNKCKSTRIISVINIISLSKSQVALGLSCSQ